MPLAEFGLRRCGYFAQRCGRILERASCHEHPDRFVRVAAPFRPRRTDFFASGTYAPRLERLLLFGRSPRPGLLHVMHDPLFGLPPSPACAARLVAAKWQVTEHTKRRQSIDFIHEWIDHGRLWTFHNDAHGEYASQEPNGVPLCSPKGASGELILGMHVKLCRRPFCLGYRVANQDTPAQRHIAEKLAARVLAAHLTLNRMWILNVLAAHPDKPRENVAQRPSNA